MDRRIVKILFFCFCSLVIQAQNSSINGEVFTPKGDLRVLIIFAGFKGFDQAQNMEAWKSENEFPDYVLDGKCDELFFSDTAQFNNYPSPNNMSISRLFYEMSKNKRPFRMMADVYPSRINIEPTQNRSWGSMNLSVIQKLKETNPNFDWSPYDQRTNRPEYQFDNSISLPDGKPDYIIVCYRYDKSWSHQPNPNMNSWLGSGGGISVLEGVYDFKFNDKYTISSDGFHMNTVGVKEAESFRRLFQHELGHELLSCPHHFGTGNTLGAYFRTCNMGWGTSVNSSSCTRLVNSWESWMMGWIDIKHDLSNYKENGIYEIDDYATTGEVIRIKIPNTKTQYAWIENHQLKSIYDQSRWTGSLENKPIGNDGMSNIDTGLFIYIEDMMPEREKIKTYLVSDMNAVNGAKFLNANGNWDYIASPEYTKSWAEYWNNVLYVFDRTEENPYDGINPFLNYRFDANKDGRIENQHNFNGAFNSEQFSIVKEKAGDSSFLFYGNHASSSPQALKYRRVHSFVVGDTLSMSHNPPLTNNPKYNLAKASQEATYINGLRIQVLSVQDGKYTLRINFDNNQVHKDLRLSGNLILANIENTDIDFNVQKGVTVKVNKSNTINTLKSNGGTFINETQWLIDSAFVQLNENAKLQVEDSSVVMANNKSKIILIKSEIKLNDKGNITFEEGSELIFDKKSILNISENATVIIQKGALLNGLVLSKQLILTGEKLTGKKFVRKYKRNI